MNGITDADREAADALRLLLADLSGFWFKPGEEGPLVAALARHRIDAEQRLADKLAPFIRHAEAPDVRPPAARENEIKLPALQVWGPFLA